MRDLVIPMTQSALAEPGRPGAGRPPVGKKPPSKAPPTKKRDVGTTMYADGWPVEPPGTGTSGMEPSRVLAKARDLGPPPIPDDTVWTPLQPRTAQSAPQDGRTGPTK